MNKKKQRILFVGDSITDCGRREEPEQIGDGYVRLIRDAMICENPLEAPELINRGVGGDRVTDLMQRWERDVLLEQPDMLSVSIGINDVWRQLDSPGMEQVLVGKFEETYRSLLNKSAGITLVLMEPTIIEENAASKGNELLKPYAAVVQKLAEEYGALLVPTHAVFIAFLEKNSGTKLTTDGVHMNSTGNMLMARTWMQAVNKKTGR